MKYAKPVSKIDALRAAKLLIDEYGTEAWFIAAQRADGFLAQGDIPAQRTWLAVHRAVVEILRTTRDATEALH